MLAEAPAIATAVETDGCPIDFFLAFIESDPLTSESDRAWFRDLLGTPEPRA